MALAQKALGIDIITVLVLTIGIVLVISFRFIGIEIARALPNAK